MVNQYAQAGVTAVLKRAIATLGEIGLQVAAYHHGALVVDAWAGVADPQSAKPVDGDTLFTAFSMSKGITATITPRRTRHLGLRRTARDVVAGVRSARQGRNHRPPRTDPSGGTAVLQGATAVGGTKP